MKKVIKKLLVGILIGIFSLSLFETISIEAKAEIPADWPQSINVSDCDHSNYYHFYATGNTFIGTLPGAQGNTIAEGRVYKLDGTFWKDSVASATDAGCYAKVFEGGQPTSPGFYYYDTSRTTYTYDLYRPCNGDHLIHSDSIQSDSSSHEHSWTHGVIYEATETTDGLEGDMCSCGAVANTSPISAHRFACDEAEKKA